VIYFNQVVETYYWGKEEQTEMARITHGPTAYADERRQALIQAAYQSIGQHGLKGLRTREVAAQVGLDHSTLHYYFPTKIALIEAVAEYAVFQGLLVNIPRDHQEGSPAARLHAFLSTLLRNMREEPTHFLVLYELARSTPQEPALRDILQRQPFMASWHRFLVLLLRAGIEAREFRADLDPEIGASILMTFILGLGTSLFMPVPADAEQMIQHLERWLTG
jgi:AcrR family transcriptional regulator